MPDRLLGDRPVRRAAYVMIALALLIVALAVWNVSLSRRVSQQESIRASEARAKVAREASECRARVAGTRQANDLLKAIRELAVIPQQNLRDVLSGPLTAKERSDRLEALARYRAAQKRIHTFPLPTCVSG